jgi:hypothetical protein
VTPRLCSAIWRQGHGPGWRQGYGPVWRPRPTRLSCTNVSRATASARLAEAVFDRDDLHTRAAPTFRHRRRAHARRSPVRTPGPTHSRTARTVPRAITNPRTGDALFGRAPTMHVSAPACRERRTHAWAKPVWPPGPTTLTDLHVCENDPEPTHKRRSSGRGTHTHALLAVSRERSRPHAWAKPCLAATTYTLTHRSTRSDGDRDRTHGRSPVWRADPRRSYERNLPSSTPRVAARLGWSFLITP